MIEINIPGYKNLRIKNIVFDYNGTLAVDGIPLAKSIEHLKNLNKKVNVYVLTADTFGTSKKYLPDEISLKIIGQNDQQFKKRDFVQSLGANETIAVGNGLNDILMVKIAVLGVAILDKEGCANQTLKNADLIYKNIIDFLESLENKKRIIATLRK